jgi:hypothetical protein
MLSMSTLSFIIAHEYSHAILGHLDNNYNPNSINILSKEIETDLVAVKILMNNAWSDLKYDNREIPLEPGTRLAGIVFGITLLEILNQRKSILNGTKIYHDYFMRIYAILPELDKKYNFHNYPTFLIINDALNLIHLTTSYYSKKENPSTAKEILLKKYYSAYKNKRCDEFEKIIKNNLIFFDEWVSQTIFLLAITSDTKARIRSMSSNWSYPDTLDYYEFFSLMVETNIVVERLAFKDRKTEIKQVGETLIRNLLEKERLYENDGSINMKNECSYQSKKIRALLKNIDIFKDCNLNNVP